MGRDERLSALFRAVLDLPPDADVSTCRPGHPPSWDSMAHVSLVAAMEGEFGLTIDPTDSLAITSFEAAREYLSRQGA